MEKSKRPRERKLPLKRRLLNASDDVSRRWPTATIAICNVGLVVCFIGMMNVYRSMIEEGADKYLEIVRFIMS